MAEIIKKEMDGQRFQAARFGSGGKTMVILPGISLRPVVPAAEGVEAAYALFKKDYTVYLCDMPLCLTQGITVEEMSRQMGAFLQSLGIRNGYFFGASQGGSTALYLARYFPETVKALVLSPAFTGPDGHTEIITARWADLARRGKIAQLAEEIAETIYSPGTLAVFRDAIIGDMSAASSEDAARYACLAEACATVDCRPFLAGISRPTLVLTARGDRVTPPEISIAAARKLGAQQVVYGPEYGHGVYDEAPDFKEKLKTFFDEIQ